MKAKIVIQMDNAAFEDDPSVELARILQELAVRVTGASLDKYFPLLSLRDINGNCVGELEVTE